MKYFVPMTVEEIDNAWYNGVKSLGCIYHKDQVLFVQSSKDGHPRIDGRACVYRLAELKALRYDFAIVNPKLEYENIKPFGALTTNQITK